MVSAHPSAASCDWAMRLMQPRVPTLYAGREGSRWLFDFRQVETFHLTTSLGLDSLAESFILPSLTEYCDFADVDPNGRARKTRIFCYSPFASLAADSSFQFNSQK